jgi:hypothetical protein
MQYAVVKRAAAVCIAVAAALSVAAVAAGTRTTTVSGERGVAAPAGYTFDTGTVRLVHGANPSYWTTAQAQGAFCGGQPLGEPWHVWGKYVQYIEGEPHVNPMPADGTATFDADGKQASRSVQFPWFVQEMSVRLSESPPTASIWFWNGQAVSRQEVVVELQPNPQCTLTVSIRSLGCTPQPALPGKLMTGKATVAVTRGGKPATLAPTAKVAWQAKLGTLRLKTLSTARTGNALRATWQLPKAVKTKVVRVTLTVTSDGVTATKMHLHRVR